MPNIQFEDAVSAILAKDFRFKKDGYYFIKDSLDFTVKALHDDELIGQAHVSGAELLEGFKDFAMKEFGSMALPVLESWGIHSGKDVGAMVYNLINEKAFGRSEEDHPTDFENFQPFERVFRDPYSPSRPVLTTQVGTLAVATANQPATQTKRELT